MIDFIEHFNKDEQMSLVDVYEVIIDFNPHNNLVEQIITGLSSTIYSPQTLYL